MAFVCDIPALPTVLQDDSAARITRWDFEPGATTGQHTHGHPYFVVLLTPATLRVKAGDTITETSLNAGDSYMRAAGAEHDVQNGSDHNVSFVEIEIKTGDFLHQFKSLI